MRLFLLTPAVCLWIGCAASGSGKYGEPRDSSQENDDTSASGPSDTANDQEQAPHVWFSINAELELTESQANALYDLNFYPEAIEEGPTCTLSFQATKQTLQTHTPDESIIAWWNLPDLDLSQPDGCEGSHGLAKNIQLGLGQLHSALLPSLSENGVDTTDTKNIGGAYIGFNENPPSEDEPGTAYVLGYAQSDQTDTNAESALGSFSLTGVFLFPIAQATDTGLDHGGQ
jgi:hypothetical protein